MAVVASARLVVRNCTALDARFHLRWEAAVRENLGTPAVSHDRLHVWCINDHRPRATWCNGATDAAIGTRSERPLTCCASSVSAGVSSLSAYARHLMRRPPTTRRAVTVRIVRSSPDAWGVSACTYINVFYPQKDVQPFGGSSYNDA
jgi:hypothetical protein